MSFPLNLLRTAALAGLAALLASCGGGSQIESFTPNRVVVFGDEASRIEADPAFPGEGRKYTVNGIELDSSGALTNNRKCNLNQIWVQQLAYNYGFAFPQCATTGYSATAEMYAEVGGTVASVTAQIDNVASTLGPKDLVTVMVGTHDILAAASAADPVGTATAAGTAAGAQVVRLTELGAKVIVATVPDVGSTPQGRLSAQSATLTNLTYAFNTALRIKLNEVKGGGHSAGLVLADELVVLMMRHPSNYSIANITDAACVTALPDCDQRPAYLSETPDARTNKGWDWLWAGPYQLGANAHNRIGELAVSRARNNPF